MGGWTDRQRQADYVEFNAINHVTRSTNIYTSHIIDICF